MIRRSGNFGFVDNGAGEIYTFSLNARSSGWTPSSFMIRGGRSSFGMSYISGPDGSRIIPFGADNDLPGYVARVLEKFYAGEGIMGKKAGLQWGEGPRLYRDAVAENNTFYREWAIDKNITGELEVTNYLTEMHRCLIDLCHLEGFWVKITLSRGRRIGEPKIAKIEHVPASKVRFVYPGDDHALPTHAMVADWPFPNPKYSYTYPLFDPHEPFKHPITLGYYNIYSYLQTNPDKPVSAPTRSDSCFRFPAVLSVFL